LRKVEKAGEISRRGVSVTSSSECFMFKRSFQVLAVMAIAAVTVVAGEIKLDGVSCVVASRDAQMSKSAEYKDAKVFFCCNGCAGKFAKSPEKYTEQANRQLVETGQYEQKACPISGAPLSGNNETVVADVKVGFCCGKCEAKVEGADEKKQLVLVFGEEAFEKAFEKAESEE